MDIDFHDKESGYAVAIRESLKVFELKSGLFFFF